MLSEYGIRQRFLRNHQRSVHFSRSSSLGLLPVTYWPRFTAQRTTVDATLIDLHVLPDLRLVNHDPCSARPIVRTINARWFSYAPNRCEISHVSGQHNFTLCIERVCNPHPMSDDGFARLLKSRLRRIAISTRLLDLLRNGRDTHAQHC